MPRRGCLPRRGVLLSFCPGGESVARFSGINVIPHVRSLHRGRLEERVAEHSVLLRGPPQPFDPSPPPLCFDEPRSERGVPDSLHHRRKGVFRESLYPPRPARI